MQHAYNRYRNCVGWKPIIVKGNGLFLGVECKETRSWLVIQEFVWFLYGAGKCGDMGLLRHGPGVLGVILGSSWHMLGIVLILELEH